MRGDWINVMCNLPFLTPDPMPGKDSMRITTLLPDCNPCDNPADQLLPLKHKVQPLSCHAKRHFGAPVKAQEVLFDPVGKDHAAIVDPRGQ